MDEGNIKLQLIYKLQHQVSVARNEIKNLRKQIINFRAAHQNDVEKIKKILNNIQCQNYENDSSKKSCDCEFNNFKSIGTIQSWFSEKRGIPRQGVLCMEAQGILTLHPSVINNPSYALDGLGEFSHIWIIYHFHKGESHHMYTKIAPPKLNGKRVGIFSTRSPHRPCPIGLSIVKVDKISENKIYFSGVDMLDGTPVLDIKPYIPHYDNPVLFDRQNEREVEGGAEHEDSNTVVNHSSEITEKKMEDREAPDGEEDNIKFPSWIANSFNTKLHVEFTRRASCQLNEINESEKLKKAIINIVEEDPRSVYLKEKLGNRFYTFLIKGVHVTCKFDDLNGCVIIYQIKQANEDCQCGIPEWQCSEHEK